MKMFSSDHFLNYRAREKMPFNRNFQAILLFFLGTSNSHWQIFSTCYAIYCLSYWGFSDIQNKQNQCPHWVSIWVGRQIIVNKYITCVINNTLWRRTNSEKKLENERVLFWIQWSEKVSLRRSHWSRDLQRSGVKRGRNRVWMSPEAAAHGCVWGKSRMLVVLGVQWLSGRVVREGVDR